MSRRERRLLRRSGKKHEEHSSEATKITEETAKREETEIKEKKNISTHKNKLLDIYDKKYKTLLIIPVAILFLAIVFLGINFAVTGEFVNKGISLKGGVTLSVPSDQQTNIEELESFLKTQIPYSDISVRSLRRAGEKTGFIVDATDIKPALLLKAVEKKTGSLKNKQYSLEEMGSSLGKSFFKETIVALLMAFAFMGIVVFIYFRLFIPSVAVVLAAASDIIVTLAIVNLLGIKLSTAGIAAFLMLIGYSVDTDILLTTRVLKREEGTVFSRVVGALKTSMTMTTTTIVALIIALIFTQSETLKQIMLILLIGLLVDIINTWIQNVGILRIYIEKRKVNIKSEFKQ